MELNRQLELLRDIWALFENAKEAAKAWEETEREERRKVKRKHKENDTDTYSLTTK
jgi:predicted RNase H-like HicB family nuclease